MAALHSERGHGHAIPSIDGLRDLRMRSAAEVDKYAHELQIYSTFSALQSAVLDSDEHLPLLDGLRSVLWKIFLLFHNLDESKWTASLANSRSAYDALRAHYLRAIDNPDEVDSAVDPLSENTESPWTALRNDEAIRQEIFQDIERCMPENTYFRQPDTQAMLLDVLFIYTKLNPDVGYRQGMHELLAPILWTIERDAVTSYGSGQAILDVLDSRYIEHDTFTLFTEVMRTAKSFYDPGLGSRPAARGSRGTTENESAMLVRCRHIFSHLLARYDPGLAAHLEELDISPQLFLMRWIRLLFGREFSFNDTLQVWDLLFAEDPSLELIDYISVAMILRIRWQLVEADSNEALMLLMRYTSPKDAPRTFVQDARFLKRDRSANVGNDIIKKYSGRVPPVFAKPSRRSSTPDVNVAPGTPQSQRARSPFLAPSVPGGLDSLIGEAARGVMNRGEKWGFNQALRDAVGEVKKNVQTLQSGRASPRTSMLGASPGHRYNKSSEVSGNIAANVLRRMTAIEDRSKQLSKMLEGAVSELWNVEKDVADKRTLDDDRLQALSMAIAKVQFVQVFLQDSTLPLPLEEKHPSALEDVAKIEQQGGSTIRRAQEDQSDLSVRRQSDNQPKPAPMKAPIIQVSPTPIAIKQPSVSTPPPGIPTTSVSAEHASATKSATSSSLGRPRLEQSNFSFMLGQAHDESNFVRASPFAPSEKRSNATHARTAFLFGEEDDVVGESRVTEKGKSKANRKNSTDQKSLVYDDLEMSSGGHA